jgi:hypothetical protein
VPGREAVAARPVAADDAMNVYHREQIESLVVVRTYLAELPAQKRFDLMEQARGYLSFRRETARFLERWFGAICTESCYHEQVSACCSKEGIITFFADMVINALVSPPSSLNRMLRALEKENRGTRCVYLGSEGCLWQLKPIVCEMFICERARAAVFGNNPAAEKQWRSLEARKKDFTWPDRPVLFDRLEAVFIAAGYNTALMYLHNSPGLLRIKSRAGLVPSAGS